MKKKYVKPKIFYESFELSSSIAAGCEVLATPMANYECAVYDPEIKGTIFTTAASCKYTSPGIYDKVCYDVPFENHNVFNS